MSDAIVPKGQPIPGDPEKKGWLFKWTNYLKGYQRRWFVLSNGLLSYYRNQAEMAHTCRGTISLLGALIHTADSCTFVISNGGTQTFHIRAHDEVERQSWVTALELAKAKAIRAQESDDEEDGISSGTVALGAGEGEGEDAGSISRELAARFHDLRTCSELVARHGAALQRSLVDLEIPPSDNTKQVSERATLFRISCNAMMNACSEFMTAAAASSARMSRALQHEREQKMRLQEVVEQLARQHDNLEKSVTGRSGHTGGTGTAQGNETEDEDHEFFDAVEGVPTAMDDKTAFVMKVPVNRKNKVKRGESSDDSEGETVTETQQATIADPLSAAPSRAAGVRDTGSRPSLKGSLKSAIRKITDSRPATTAPSTAGSSRASLDCECETGSGSSLKDSLKNSIRNIKVVLEQRKSGEFHPVVFVEDRGQSSMGSDGGACKAKGEVKIWPHVTQVVSMVDGHPRRTSVPEKPNYPLSLWSIMKNCIGKELSKIPIPVNFSEPLSMLQRLTEEYEYSSVLDSAAQFSDPAQQLAYVAAFTVSSYATTACRTNKPFNPLLGETFECDRMSDLGWRSVSEQVSHHPPMVAQFCEGLQGWQCWQEFTMSTKFRGKYLQIIPLGGASCSFNQSGNKYSWRKVQHHPPTTALHCEGAAGWVAWQEFHISSRFRGHFISVEPDGCSNITFLRTGNMYRWTKVTTTVHNIIVGKLWVDNHGDMDIVGEAGAAAGYVAHLKYMPYGYFSKESQRKVTGVVKDPQGVPRYVLQGHWDSCVEVAPITSASDDNTQCKTGKFTIAWQRIPEPPDSDKWYNFTLLAAQLNELEKGVAPTDSRLRPDQRLMEEGLWDEANKEKVRLEEKQRLVRRQAEAAAEAAAEAGLPAPPPTNKPVWFTREASQLPGNALRHMYNHRYWECKLKQDWAGCPDIY